MSKKKRVKTTSTVKRSSQVALTRDDVLSSLGNAVPKDARNIRVFVQVPGGGDWSNAQLDIDENTAIIVEWETVEVEEITTDVD